MPSHREDRVSALLRIFRCGRDLGQEVSIPRKARRLDFLLVGLAEHPMFFRFADDLADRAVALSHFSRGPTLPELAGVQMSSAWLLREWLRARGLSESGRSEASELGRYLRATRLHPIALILTESANLRAISTSRRFGEQRPAGVWRDRHDRLDPALVLDINRLPPEPGFHLLRALATLSDEREAVARMDALLGDPTVPTIMKRHFIEAAMKKNFPTNPGEPQTAFERAVAIGERRGVIIGERRGVKIGEQQGERRGKVVGQRVALLRIARNLLGPAAADELEEIEDLGTLEREVERRVRDAMSGDRD